MAEIKSAEVVKLRKQTGAGMMDCKNALIEANGDFDKAVDIIRKKGRAIANKRADKEASEGVVLARTAVDGKTGYMIVLNCETDFVAKNEGYVKFAESILDIAVKNSPDTLDELKALKMDGKTVADIITEQVGVIGEKLDLAFYGKIIAEQVATYIHPGNKLASMAGLNMKVSDLQVGKDICMQVAAMNPIAVDKENVSQTMIDKEIEIGKDQARQEGKPEEIVEKIALGKLNKFFKESTLLNQDFIKENKISVRQYLQGIDKSLTVTEFIRFTLSD